MKTVQLKLTSEDGATHTEVSGDFTEDDLRLLRQYRDQMSRVRDAELVQRGMPFISNLGWKAGEGLRFTCPEFSNKELYELLHVLRPVMLEREVASFHRTQALLGRRFQDKTFASHQRYIRQLYEDGELSMYMQITVGDQKLLDDSVLHMWLNGTQYHTDIEKAEAWSKLEKSLTSENARAILITQLHSRVKALFTLEQDAALVLGDADA